jgi:predicted nucleic acid-binding protein
MNGARFLLDTNFIIGLLKGHPAIAELVRERGMVLAECTYSSITRMELLGYPGITGEHEQWKARLDTAWWVSRQGFN